MPDVASIDTDVSCRDGGRTMVEVHDFFTGNELISYEGFGFADGVRGLRTRRSRGHNCRRGDLRGAQINLVHNVFRPTAWSTMTTGEGATYGAW